MLETLGVEVNIRDDRRISREGYRSYDRGRGRNADDEGGPGGDKRKMDLETEISLATELEVRKGIIITDIQDILLGTVKGKENKKVSKKTKRHRGNK